MQEKYEFLKRTKELKEDGIVVGWALKGIRGNYQCKIFKADLRTKTSNKFTGFMTLIKQQIKPDDDAHGHKNSYLLAFSSRKNILCYH